MPKPIVYLVDDQPICLQPMATLVQAFGYEAGVHHSGEELLDNIAADQNAMVFADMRMPGMNGLELFQKLRDAGHRYPFILVSGHADDELVRQAIDLGVTAFLSKPLVYEDLHRTIEEHLCSSKPNA